MFSLYCDIKTKKNLCLSNALENLFMSRSETQNGATVLNTISKVFFRGDGEKFW